MKYQLMGEINPEYSAIEQILVNRGIPYNEINAYLNTTDADINSPILLEEHKLEQALRHIV